MPEVQDSHETGTLPRSPSPSTLPPSLHPHPPGMRAALIAFSFHHAPKVRKEANGHFLESLLAAAPFHHGILQAGTWLQLLYSKSSSPTFPCYLGEVMFRTLSPLPLHNTQTDTVAESR